MNRDDWQALIERFAPQVLLSNKSPYQDPYAPSSIDWYLDRCSLRDRDDPSVFIRHPSRADLVANPQPSRYLDPDDETVYLGRQEGSQIYVHLRNATDPDSVATFGWLDIQYWMFYPYNGSTGGTVPVPIYGIHEGDWEHVTVRVSNWRNLAASAVEGVFYAAHTAREGRWLVRRSATPTYGSYAVWKDTHPIVYSAWHSHASYESEGIQWRSETGYLFGNDYCAGGRTWGPLSGPDLEFLSVDDDVYQSGDEKIPTAGWTAFAGRWGSSGDSSPQGPVQKTGVYASDGANGYYVAAVPLADFGSGWSKSRATNSVALGVLGGRSVLAAGLNGGGGDRFQVYDWRDDGLELLAAGGRNWNSNRGCTGVALGRLADRQVLAAGRSSGDNSRFEVYEYSDGSGLDLLASGGTSWGDSRGCSAVALGALGNEQVLGVGRTGGDGPRFEIYRWSNGLELLASGGSEWTSGQDCTAIAFGVVPGESAAEQVVAVGRSAADGARFEIYRWLDDRLELQAQGGASWGSGRGTTGLAFGVLGGKPVLGVSRDAGDNFRFRIYHFLAGRLAILASGGEDWGSSRGATGIAFGSFDVEGTVAVSRTRGDKTKVKIYAYRDGALVQGPVYGEDWGNSRDATAVAAGPLGPRNVVAYGRSSGEGTRGGVLGAE